LIVAGCCVEVGEEVGRGIDSGVVVGREVFGILGRVGVVLGVVVGSATAAGVLGAVPQPAPKIMSAERMLHRVERRIL
jgi:hypothetical protein